MPHHKSCVKRVRKSKQQNVKNSAMRSRMRTAIKTVRGSTSKEQGQTALTKAFSAIDKNVKAGIIHRNAASNRKARLSRLVNKLG